MTGQQCSQARARTLSAPGSTFPPPGPPDLGQPRPEHHGGRTLWARAPRRRPLGLEAPLGTEIPYPPVGRNTKKPSQTQRLGGRGRGGAAPRPPLFCRLTNMTPVAPPPSRGEGEAHLHWAGGSGAPIRGSTGPKTESGFRCRHWMSALTLSHGLASSPPDTTVSCAPVKPHFSIRKCVGSPQRDTVRWTRILPFLDSH